MGAWMTEARTGEDKPRYDGLGYWTFVPQVCQNLAEVVERHINTMEDYHQNQEVITVDSLLSQYRALSRLLVLADSEGMMRLPGPPALIARRISSWKARFPIGTHQDEVR